MFFKLSLVALIALVGSVSCSLQGLVVKGINSDIKKYQFMVSLRDDEGRHICGGTLVSVHFVLTAAHCVSDKKPSELSVQYGFTKISVDSKNVIKVKRIIIHENYDKLRLFDYDIALLELEKAIFYNSKPVKIADLSYDVSKNGILLGWGAKSASGKAESNLQEVKLKIFSNKECNNLNEGYISIRVLCAGVDKGSTGTCHGDSGGPLLSKDSAQLGIASSSADPCVSSFGVYTKVSYYTSWIAEHTK